MTETDWKAEARKWEARSKTNLAETIRLNKELQAAKESSRSWRTAYHSLRITLEGRLDRIADTLEIDYADDNQGDTK